MAHVSASVDIDAAPVQTWAVIADPSQFAAWVDNHDGFVGDPPTGYEAGASFRQRLTVLGMPAEVGWTVQQVEAPSKVVLTGQGPMGMALTATYQVMAAGAGSRAQAEFAFSGAAVVAVGAQLKSGVGSSLEASLAALKTVVEQAGRR